MDFLAQTVPETIRTLLGLLRSNKGKIRMLDAKIPRQLQRIIEKIGVAPGDIHLYEELSGLQFLDYLQGFLKGEPKRRKELIEAFGLSELDLHKKIRYYSQGMKQKILLIQAMQHNPELLILDEPSERLDPLHQQVLYDLLKALKEKGHTIFFSSHNLPEVEKICDHVGIIKDGELLIQHSVADLKKNIPRTMEIWFDADYDLKAFTHDQIRIVRSEDRYIKLEFSGDIDFLTKKCAELKIKDIVIPAPSMESLFMQYYKTPDQ